MHIGANGYFRERGGGKAPMPKRMYMKKYILLTAKNQVFINLDIFTLERLRTTDLDIRDFDETSFWGQAHVTY